MTTFSFKEDKIPEKLNFSVWLKMFKYTKDHWILLTILTITMLLTAFYDASFTPLMNASLIQAVSTSSSSNIQDLVINVHLIFGISFQVNFLWYSLLFLFGIIIRAFTIFFTFYITNLLEMYVMTSLRRDSFRRVQELSFSYYDRTPSCCQAVNVGKPSDKPVIVRQSLRNPRLLKDGFGYPYQIGVTG